MKRTENRKKKKQLIPSLPLRVCVCRRPQHFFPFTFWVCGHEKFFFRIFFCLLATCKKIEKPEIFFLSFLLFSDKWFLCSRPQKRKFLFFIFFLLLQQRKTSPLSLSPSQKQNPIHNTTHPQGLHFWFFLFIKRETKRSKSTTTQLGSFFPPSHQLNHNNTKKTKDEKKDGSKIVGFRSRGTVMRGLCCSGWPDRKAGGCGCSCWAQQPLQQGRPGSGFNGGAYPVTWRHFQRVTHSGEAWRSMGEN